MRRGGETLLVCCFRIFVLSAAFFGRQRPGSSRHVYFLAHLHGFRSTADRGRAGLPRGNDGARACSQGQNDRQVASALARRLGPTRTRGWTGFNGLCIMYDLASALRDLLTCVASGRRVPSCSTYLALADRWWGIGRRHVAQPGAVCCLAMYFCYVKRLPSL